MSKPYRVGKVTSETWEAVCKKCGKPFRNDAKWKVIKRVEDHIKDAHGET